MGVAEFLLYPGEPNAVRQRKVAAIDGVPLGSGEDFRALGLDLSVDIYRDDYWHGASIEPVLAEVRRVAASRREAITRQILGELGVAEVKPWTQPVLDARLGADQRLRLLSHLQAILERALAEGGTVMWASD